MEGRKCKHQLGLYQGDALSPVLLYMYLNPLNNLTPTLDISSSIALKSTSTT